MLMLRSAAREHYPSLTAWENGCTPGLSVIVTRANEHFRSNVTTGMYSERSSNVSGSKLDNDVSEALLQHNGPALINARWTLITSWTLTIILRA